MTAPTKIQRWLDLIACLVGRSFPISTGELMRSVPAYAKGWASTDPKIQESTRRSFERDKDKLRKAGIPIRTVRYSVNHAEEIEGYQIDKRDFYLPYLKLVSQHKQSSTYSDRHRPDTVTINEEDAPLALQALLRVGDVPGFPLARESRSAFRKLAFALDMSSFAASNRVLYVDPPGAAELAGQLRTLSDAVAAKKRIAFDYHGIYRGSTTKRDVAGYGMMFQHGHWYVVGHDARRDDIRVFRVGRMENISVNTKKPGQPDYETPSDFHISAYADREPWTLGERDEEPLVARVRFTFPLSLWAERNNHGALIAKEPDGAQLREFTLHQVDPFLRWILSLEGDALIVDPPSLKQELQNMAQTVVAAHGGARA